MPTLLQKPETPIAEAWQWQTNVIVSDDATEQRIDLCEYPNRQFGLTYAFDAEDDLRRELALMTKFGAQFDAPLFHYQTRLKAIAAMGSDTLSILANRTDLRVGGKAYVFDKDGGEVGIVEAIVSDTLTLTAGLSRAYDTRAAVCPVRPLYSAGSAALDRLNPDRAARASWTLREAEFNAPFLHAFNTFVLTMLGTLPVLEARPIGTEFNEAVDTGAKVTDYGGAIDIRNRWLHAQQTFNRRFNCYRTFEPDDWDMWRAFADYCKGSCNPFYLPTYRADFELNTAPALGGTTFVFEGSSYRTDYFPYEPFKAVAIFTAAGVHYATVTNAVDSAGNTTVTFDPALPGTAGWNVNTSISLLLKCRIADDRVMCEHFPLHTEVALNIRTVDA